MNTLRPPRLALLPVAILFALTSTAPAAEAPNGNLLQNGNFENGTAGWDLSAFDKKGTMAVDQDELHDGKPTLRVTAVDDLTYAHQTVKVKPNTQYRLSGHIKTKEVKDLRGTKSGAILLMGNSPYATTAIHGTIGWTKVSADLSTKEKTEIRVGPAVGRYANHVAGTAWFSDLSLIELGPSPENLVAHAPDAAPPPAGDVATLTNTPALSNADLALLGDIVKTNHGNLVFVNGTNGAGSGFIARVGNASFVFTNAHVAAGVKGATFKTLDGAEVKAVTPLVAVGHDIFRMSVASGGKPLELMDRVGENAAIGDDIVVLGNAEGAGVVTGIRGRILGIGPTLIEVDAPFVPGNSGSPIIQLKTGKVIGVATYMVVRNYDLGTMKEVKEPKIRRFGYRLDSVKSWQLVNWDYFAAQAAELESIEKLTQDLDKLLVDIAEHQRVTPGLHTNPVIKRPIELWLADHNGQSSASDRAMAEQTFLSRLKSVCTTDVSNARTRLTYDYFQRQLAEQQHYRESMATAFESLSPKRSGN